MELVLNRADWDNYFLNAPYAPFTQSGAWADILKTEGLEVERITVLDKGAVIAAALVSFHVTPLGHYAMSPGGPVITARPESVYAAIAEYLKNKKCIFWRVEPNEPMFGALPSKKTIDVTPRTTTVADLAPSVTELISRMHPKTRYNIHLAEKKGVTVTDGKDWDSFWRLMRQTGERDGFRLHPEKHYRAIFASPATRQLAAVVGGQVVATAVFIGFGSTFTYLFGASDYAHRAVMAPHRLQWEAMKLGKQLGYAWYDFFGIAPRQYCPPSGEPANGEYLYEPKHQYAGVTRFKLGFGGGVVARPGTYDLIISPGRYRMYGLLRILRRMA